MKTMPPHIAERCWTLAGRITWTAEDWADFHESLTAVFARIAARHAKRMIDKTPK